MGAPERIRALLDEQAEIANRDVVEALGVSPATSHRLLQGLVLAGALERRGKGRASRYRLRPVRVRRRLAGLEEDRVWREVETAIAAARPLGGEEANSLRYAATEAINNAVDHSGGKSVTISVDFEPLGTTTARIVDDGVGVFRRICEDFGYPSAQEAIVHLEKGKLTSDPSRHSGEGLFFSSKAVARFRLEAGGVGWVVDNIVADSGIGVSNVVRGTTVSLQIVRDHTPSLKEVFATYTDPDTLRFSKTRTTVKLSAFGSTLISRSEAKRVVERLPAFTHVVLDFTGIDVVGQGFCDEIFRVFADRHPQITLEPVGMNDMIAFMVSRATAAAQSPQRS